MKSIVVVLICWPVVAWAHGPEQWVADSKLTDPVSHQWCCGPSDCQVLEDGQAQEAHGGWLVKTQEDKEPEFIPYDRALPFSPDGKYHRCIKRENGKISSRCFIVPPPTY